MVRACALAGRTGLANRLKMGRALFPRRIFSLGLFPSVVVVVVLVLWAAFFAVSFVLLSCYSLSFAFAKHSQQLLLQPTVATRPVITALSRSIQGSVLLNGSFVSHNGCSEFQEIVFSLNNLISISSALLSSLCVPFFRSQLAHIPLHPSPTPAFSLLLTLIFLI